MYNLTIISFVAIVLLGSVCVHAQKDMHESVLDRFAKNYWSKIYENVSVRLHIIDSRHMYTYISHPLYHFLYDIYQSYAHMGPNFIS